MLFVIEVGFTYYYNNVLCVQCIMVHVELHTHAIYVIGQFALVLVGMWKSNNGVIEYSNS